MPTTTIPSGLFERDYAQNAILQKGFNAQIVEDLISYILRVFPAAKERPIKILDLCCGDGGITAVIFTKLIQAGILIDRLVGCDISPDQIEVATEQHGKVDTRLIFRCEDASKVSMQNKYDVIISLFGLHWIPNIEHMAKVINTVLKDDGKLMYFVPLEKTQFFSKRHALVNSEKWAPHFKGFLLQPFIADPGRYSRAFSKLFTAENPGGITGTECVTFSYDNFKRFLSSWMQEIRHLPIELREEFLNDLLARLPLERPGILNDVEKSTATNVIKFYERFKWFHASNRKARAMDVHAQETRPSVSKL